MESKPIPRWRYFLRELAWLAAVGLVSFLAAKLANHYRVQDEALKATSVSCADGSEPLVTKGNTGTNFTVHCP